MNGHLTHSWTQIYDQLMFSVQVNQAVQYLSTFLNNEDEKTSLPHKNMLQVALHVYAVGTIHYCNLTEEEQAAVSLQMAGTTWCTT